MPRAPSHSYVDPLDHIWLATAQRVGLRVERSAEAYAAKLEGRVLVIATAEHLDPDDCLAQMIFHELCHSLVQGEESFALADWGLDNTDDRDVVREHACLRLQAALASRHGLREVLAPTTEFRAFYDELESDPLSPRREPSAELARIALRRAATPPWSPHLAPALAATATIARQAALFALRGTALPALLGTARDAPAPHPTGLPGSDADPARRCGNCGWRDGERCLQADASVDAGQPGCERWEPTIDCLDCGACCRAAYHSVTIDADDPVVALHPELVRRREGYLELSRTGDRCSALGGGKTASEPFGCVIYDDRPRCCRDFERGGEHCLTARRRVGLSL